MLFFLSKADRERRRIIKTNSTINSDNIIELHDSVKKLGEEYAQKCFEIQSMRERIVEKDFFLEVNNETNKRIGEVETNLLNELNDNYIKLVNYLLKKTNEILWDYNSKYQGLFESLGTKFLSSEEKYLDLYEEIEKLKQLEETYKSIANNLIDERIASEIPTKKTAEMATNQILNAFNAELSDLNKEQKETIYKSLFDVLLTRKIVSATTEERDIKSLPENSKFHAKYNQLKNCVIAGVIPMIVGPAGSGKSHAIEQVASDLGLHFYMANRIQNTFELVGFVNAAGNYVTTQFYEAFTKGGLFFFDEVDASSPEALVTINAAVAQGYMAFPGHPTTIDMHKDFKVVVAGNTYGTGSTLQYTGRNKLDAATLDRFMIIDWNYDEDLENELIEDKDLLEICWALRKASTSVDEVIISTRGILTLDKVIKQEKNTHTMDLEEVFVKKFFAGLDKNKIERIISRLSCDPKNKYYNVVCHL